MLIYDSHTHSRFSEDGCEEPRDMAEAALRNGISGICITDHYDCDEIPLFGDLQRVGHTRDAVAALQGEYEGRLTVRRGIELAQGPMRPDEAAAALAVGSYDFVLGSVHAARWKEDFYWVDYKKPPYPLEQIIREYFEACLTLARWDKVDAIAHLGYLKRYATGRDGVPLDYTPCTGLIEEVLRALIETGKALEINTSGLRYGLGSLIPEVETLRRYRELGGELVTIGSDAHRAVDIGAGHREAQEALRAAGFRYFAFYRTRRPEMIPLE